MDEFLINELTVEFRKGILDIINMWVKIGITGEKFVSRSNNLKLHVKELLNDMISEEKSNMQKLIDSINNLSVEIKQLSTFLKVDLEIVSEGSLFTKENSLLKQKNQLLVIQECRIKKFRALLKMEEELCQRLFEYKLCLDQNLIPTEEQLEEFQQKILVLENLQKTRKAAFLVKRQRIMQLYNSLNKSLPDDSMIVTIFNDEDVLNVPLSEDFLKQCDYIIDNLQIKYESNINDCNQLRKRCEALQNILQPFAETVSFSLKVSENSEDFSNETLEMLKKEVSCLETRRSEKIGEVIKNYQINIRQKLINNFSSHLESTEKYLIILNSEEITESLLKNLETEFENWYIFENQLEPLRLEMKAWENLIHKIIEINKNLKDPKIILKNRGGILLKFEKEKKLVKLELPKIENKIRKTLQSLEEQNIDTFNLKINNMELRDYILHMWDQIDGEKENERKDRKIKMQNSKLDLLSTKSFKKPINQITSNNLIKSDFKKPDIQKYPCKLPVKVTSQKTISPISKIKTNLDRRFSKSYNTIPKNFSKLQLTGSNSNLYELFCEDVKGTAMTSSFLENSSKKRK